MSQVGRLGAYLPSGSSTTERAPAHRLDTADVFIRSRTGNRRAPCLAHGELTSDPRPARGRVAASAGHAGMTGAESRSHRLATATPTTTFPGQPPPGAGSVGDARVRPSTSRRLLRVSSCLAKLCRQNRGNPRSARRAPPSVNRRGDLPRASDWDDPRAPILLRRRAEPLVLNAVPFRRRSRARHPLDPPPLRRAANRVHSKTSMADPRTTHGRPPSDGGARRVLSSGGPPTTEAVVVDEAARPPAGSPVARMSTGGAGTNAAGSSYGNGPQARPAEEKGGMTLERQTPTPPVRLRSRLPSARRDDGRDQAGHYRADGALGGGL